ncbi:MAG: DUF2950 domain-containing protein [Terriglobia bacterium]
MPDASEAGDRDLNRGRDGHMATRRRMTSLRVMQRVTLAMAFLLLLSVGVFRSGSVMATERPKQAYFSTPEEAKQAVVDAAVARDSAAFAKIFGPEAPGPVVPGDEAEDKQELEEFAASVQQSAKLEKVNDTTFTLTIGEHHWLFPIPIVKEGTRWRFDTPAGMEEILNRRIGENELSTILSCRAYVLAQWEYFTRGDADNDGVAEYAQKFISSPGKRDGLYWDTAADDDPSPLGSLVAVARAEGYAIKTPGKNDRAVQRRQPYHGYYFKILTRQGPHAPGGKYNYIINGNMIAGYALAAYPADWANSGVMTFIVNQQGRVYQKDLGPKTSAIAGAMVEYDPDPTWKFVKE